MLVEVLVEVPAEVPAEVQAEVQVEAVVVVVIKVEVEVGVEVEVRVKREKEVIIIPKKDIAKIEVKVSRALLKMKNLIKKNIIRKRKRNIISIDIIQVIALHIPVIPKKQKNISIEREEKQVQMMIQVQVIKSTDVVQ